MKTFEELGVSEEIRRAIEELGFEHPMPVQEEVIPYLLGNGNDVIALAQTGTGKTAAFGIPLLERTDPTNRNTQAVVISPTRELCLQIADDLKSFAKYIKGINIVAVYGGTSIIDQIHALKHGAQIIVATPGRLIDLMHRGAAKVQEVRNVVLDEADEMLNMGFSDSINEIFDNVPADRNTLLFSATMSKDIERIALNYLHDHKEIVVGSRNEGAENVNHIYYMVNAKDKYLALKRIVDFYPRIYGIIFCRTKAETQEVADKLIRDGYNAEPLHGDLSQQQRDITMQKFRQHITQLLVATDVAARGLDVDDLSHVINYGMLSDESFYDRAKDFALLKDTEGKYFTFEEYKQLIESTQKDKDDTLVYLYATDREEQYSYIQAAKDKGYSVLLLDGQLDVPAIQMLEQKFEKSRFTRVDSDIIDRLIVKDDAPKSTLSDDESAQV